MRSKVEAEFMYYFTKVFKSKWKRMMKVVEQKAKRRNVRDVSTFIDLAKGLCLG